MPVEDIGSVRQRPGDKIEELIKAAASTFFQAPPLTIEIAGRPAHLFVQAARGKYKAVEDLLGHRFTDAELRRIHGYLVRQVAYWKRIGAYDLLKREVSFEIPPEKPEAAEIITTTPQDGRQVRPKELVSKKK